MNRCCWLYSSWVYGYYGLRARGRLWVCFEYRYWLCCERQCTLMSHLRLFSVLTVCAALSIAVLLEVDGTLMRRLNACGREQCRMTCIWNVQHCKNPGQKCWIIWFHELYFLKPVKTDKIDWYMFQMRSIYLMHVRYEDTQIIILMLVYYW